jgi:hypothetical protein
MWRIKRLQRKSETESHKAVEDAEKVVAHIKKRGAEVTTISVALRQLRESNHFAEQFRVVIKPQ